MNNTDPFDNKNFNVEIIEELKEALKSPPQNIVVNLVLSGETAALLHFMRNILTNSLNIDSNTADTYLIRSGIEREINRMQAVFNYAEKNRE